MDSRLALRSKQKQFSLAGFSWDPEFGGFPKLLPDAGQTCPFAARPHSAYHCKAIFQQATGADPHRKGWYSLHDTIGITTPLVAFFPPSRIRSVRVRDGIHMNCPSCLVRIFTPRFSRRTSCEEGGGRSKLRPTHPPHHRALLAVVPPLCPPLRKGSLFNPLFSWGSCVDPRGGGW